MTITNNMLDLIESRDFYQIYENGGKKRICFSGYIYPADDDWRVLEYCQVDFLLKDYLENPKIYDDCIISCTQYIDEVLRSEALKTANNWYDGKGATPLCLSSLSMSTPCGEYIDANERELSLAEYVIEGLRQEDKWDINISNLRIQDNMAFFDVSYMWELNGHEKHVIHKDSFAVCKDGVWCAVPLIHVKSDGLEPAESEKEPEERE